MRYSPAWYSFVAASFVGGLLSCYSAPRSAMCDEQLNGSDMRVSQLNLTGASQPLRQALRDCVFESRHVTGASLAILDAFFPPLRRDRDTMHRYGKDLYVVFRLHAKSGLTRTEDGKRLSNLCVSIDPDTKHWPYRMAVPPEEEIKIPLKTFDGGVLYYTYRVFGPEDGRGEGGVREKLISQHWDWRVCGGEFRSDKEIASELFSGGEAKATSGETQRFPADSDEAKISVNARFVTGKDMRVLDKLFDERISDRGNLRSDNDLYSLVRLYTSRSLGAKTELIRTTVEVFATDWPFPDVPFPTQSIDLAFIHMEDGVVYSVKRLDNVPQDWGGNGARSLLVSKAWNTRLRRIMIK